MVHVRVQILDVPVELFGNERWTIIRHQKRYRLQRAANFFSFPPGPIQDLGGFQSTIRVREMKSQQVPRVVVDHRDRIPPAIAGDMDIGDVHLPQAVRPLGQQIVQLSSLVKLRHKRTTFMQKPMFAHHTVRVAILDLVTGATTDRRDFLVAVPRIQLGGQNHDANDLLFDKFSRRIRRLALGQRYRLAIPTRTSNAQRIQDTYYPYHRFLMNHLLELLPKRLG